MSSPAKVIQAALEHEPWSLSTIISGLEDAQDSDGRPLFEGRASYAAREGVPFERRKCPYRDERKGRWMNVSALTQTTANLDAAVDRILGFRFALDEPLSWGSLCCSILDQLSAPGVHLLREPKTPLPAVLSVGYKVAAGYATPIRELLVLETRGIAREVSSESLLEFAHETGVLVGAREVCAGSTPMIKRINEALMRTGRYADAKPERPVEPYRVPVAKILVQQVQIGILWNLYDRACERSLFIGEIGAAALEARTEYLRQKVRQRAVDLEETEDLGPPRAVPVTLPRSMLRRLRGVTRPNARPASHTITSLLTELLETGEGAITIPDRDTRTLFAMRFSQYLETYLSVQGVLEDLERELRVALGIGGDEPVRLNPIIFPLSRAMTWYQMICGYRLQKPNIARAVMELKGTARSVNVERPAAPA